MIMSNNAIRFCKITQATELARKGNEKSALQQEDITEFIQKSLYDFFISFGGVFTPLRIRKRI